MQGRGFQVALFSVLLLGGIASVAQTAVTTTGGTVNTVPKFSGTGTISNSALSETNGKVSIATPLSFGILTLGSALPDGQTTPANGIVFSNSILGYNWSYGAIYGMGSTGFAGNLIFATQNDGSPDFNPTEKMRIDPSGNIGIGTSSPRSKIDISNGALSVTGTDQNGTAYVTSQGGTAFFGDNTLGNGLAVVPSGNVGIGTANPSAKLEVYGGITLSNGSNGVITFADGTHQSTAATGTGSGTTAASYPDITDGGGNVGIGTTTPQTKLDVAGVVNGRNYALPAYGAAQWVQIGTFTPGTQGSTLRITAFIHNGYNSLNSQDSTYTLLFKNSNGKDVPQTTAFSGNGSWYAVGFNSSIPNGSLKWVANAAGTNATAYTLYMNLPSFANGSHYAVTLDQTSSWINSGAGASDPGAASNTVMIPTAEFDLPYGNMGVGTVTPSAKLEVNGNVKLTAASGASLTFQDGSVQTVAWNGTLSGGDYAESVDVTGDRADYEPGDVMVIDPGAEGRFVKASEPYSTSVMGIYSTKPGVVGRRQKSDRSHMKEEVPMAMVGVVPTKVSAENGAIKPGDLLVTSSMPGYAMKGTDRTLLTGAIVGKALGHLTSGTGLIEVAVSLQ